jgi:hypothetical protein
MKTNWGKLLWMTISAVAFLSSTVRADVYYYNLQYDQNARLDPGTEEVGDQVILNTGPGGTLEGAAGTTFLITNFSFYYWGVGLTGGTEMRVRFYANDGAPYGSYALPNNVLFDSGYFSLDPFNNNNTDRTMVTFDTDFGAGLLVPGTFTWSIQYRYIPVDGHAGIDLFSPPTVGNNFTDYWYNNGGVWELREIPGWNADFAASFEGVVPEPSVIGLLGTGAVLALLWRKRRAASN